MTTTLPDHADLGGRPTRDGAPPIPPVTWDPRHHPTASQWIEWFLTMSGRQREYVVGLQLEMARRGAACATGMHEELLTADTLSQAQIRVQAHLEDPGGIPCPCCGQLAKRYRRKINAQMATALIKLHHAMTKWEYREKCGFFDTVPPDDPASAGVLRDDGRIYLHLPTLLGKTADEAKLHYWHLIDPLLATREDGSPRNGWWTVTDRGRAYVRGEDQLTKYALIFDGCVNGFDGPQVGIRDALGTRFNYDDLMGGV